MSGERLPALSRSSGAGKSWLPPLEEHGRPPSAAQGGPASPALPKLADASRRVPILKKLDDEEKVSMASTLRGLTLFKDLDENVLQVVPNIISMLSCKAGTVLFKQGDPPGNCYLVSSGSVGIFGMTDELGQQNQNVSGRADGVLLDFLPGEKTVDGFSRHHEDSSLGREMAKLGAGAVIGELALLNDQPRSASVQCQTDCEFYVMGRADFDNVIKEDMLKQGDEKLRFLMEHMPGMKDMPMPKPGGKVHASYLFKKAKYARGHSFLVQGQEAEPCLWAVFRGSVEFRRAETLRQEGTESMPTLPVSTTRLRPLSATKRKGMTKASSMPRLPRPKTSAGTGNLALETNDANPTGVMSRRGVLVAGGVFGSLPLPMPEPFTVTVTSAMCEVFFLPAADFSRVPRRLLDTVQEYIAAATTWRLSCHQRITDHRKTKLVRRSKDSIEGGPAQALLDGSGKSEMTEAIA
eukprot:TRINITY_DN22648_c0_g1_i1.p1 TRINITY_DN22648_c0_g1~~TRINITY_DN22648_c0_g1_i1.p1  ORF type:complete len:465 (+),score=88.86 TRINITY_DN22648_c0_g1_i1:111-1505(+)